MEMVRNMQTRTECINYFEKIYNFEDDVPYTRIENLGENGIIKYRLNYMNKRPVLVGSIDDVLAGLIWMKKERVNVDYVVLISNSDDRKELLYATVLCLDEWKIFKENNEDVIAVFVGTIEDSIKKLFENYLYLNIGQFRQIYSESIRRQTLDSKEKFRLVLECMGDVESMNVLCEIIRCRLYDDIYRLPSYHCTEKYWGGALFNKLPNENALIIGGSNGDTCFSFLDKWEDFCNIYIFEPEREDWLKQNLRILPETVLDKIIVVNKNVSNNDSEKDITLDTYFDDKKFSILTADIEGAERMMLQGGVKQIKKQRPVLAISAYHKWDDLIWFMDFAKSHLADYKFYLRKYGSIFRYNWCEVVWYAIPDERTQLEHNL